MVDLQLAKKIYRVMSWASFAGLVLVIILVLHKAPPPDVAYDAGAAARAQQKIAAAEQAKAAGQPVRVQMDRTELNSYLRNNLQLQGSAPDGAAASIATPGSPAALASSAPEAASAAAPASSASAAAGATPEQIAGSDQPTQATIEQVQSSVKDVKVDMDGDLVKAYVVFDFHGKDLSLELDGHLGTQDGYVKFDPVAGKLGSLPLPMSTLQAAVEKMMNSPENRDKLKLPPDISNIAVQNGQAVVSYK
jgi:hypothetical protein